MAASLNEATVFPSSEKSAFGVLLLRQAKRSSDIFHETILAARSYATAFELKKGRFFTGITVKLDKKLQSNYCGILLASPGQLKICLESSEKCHLS